MTTIKTGSSKDCLMHFFDNNDDAVEILVDFLKVGQKPVRNWKELRKEPRGLIIIKIRYLLEKLGYEIIELSKLTRSIRQFGKLVSFGYVDINVAYKEIGIDRAGRLLDVLHGEKTLQPDRLFKIREIVARHKEDLENIANACEKPHNNFTDKAPQKPAKVSDNRTDQETVFLLSALKSITNLLSPRLDTLLFDDVSAEQRRQFRNTATGALIFNLANEFDICVFRLNALCSEETRKRHLEELNRIRLAEKEEKR